MGADEFDDFYRGSRDRLLGLVYLLTGDLLEAQDAVQEAFIRAWQRWETLSRYDQPEAWVRMVACRIATSRWRSMRRGLRAHHRAAEPARDAAPPGVDMLDVVAAMRRLPEEQRVAIALHYLVGLPIAEVARETSAPEGTVKARLARGRRALAPLLRDDLSETLGERHA